MATATVRERLRWIAQNAKSREMRELAKVLFELCQAMGVDVDHRPSREETEG